MNNKRATAALLLIFLQVSVGWTDDSATVDTAKFDIPPLPLEAALIRFSEQANVQLVVASTDVEGKAVRGLNGEFSHRSALDELLDGTGLVHQFTADETVAVGPADLEKEAEALGNARPGPVLMAQNRPPARDQWTTTTRGDSDSPTPIEEIVVRSRRFRSAETASATKLLAPVAETPQSMSIIDEQLLNDLAIAQFYEVTNYIPGVNSGGSYGSQPNITGRGYRIRDDTGYKINGVPAGEEIFLDPVAINHLEFIRGASSLTYGETSPAGFVNIVTRRPGHEETAFRSRLGGGSFGFVRGELTASGSINDDVNGLIGVAREHSGEFYDHGSANVSAIYAAADAHVSDKLTLQITGYYNDRDTVINVGIPVATDAMTFDDFGADTGFFLPDLPWEFFPSQPWSNETQDVWFANVDLTYLLSDSLTVQILYGHAENDLSVATIEPYGAILADGTAPTFAYAFGSLFTSDAAELRFTGQLMPFGMELGYVISGEYRRRAQEYVDYEGFDGPDFNVFEPSYDIANPFAAGKLLVESGDFINEIVSGSGMFVLTPADRLRLTAGFRYDHRTSDLLAMDGSGSPIFEDGQSNTDWSGRFATLYEVLDGVNIYYSYGESVEYLFGADCNNERLIPETGRQHEIGVKTELFGEGLLVSAAVFDIETQHTEVRQICPGGSVEARSANAGETRSRGFEFEVIGRVTPNWNIIAGYAYVDAGRTDAGGDEELLATIGMGVPNTPENSFSLFTVYDFLEGPLAGLGVGGGIQYADERPADEFGTLALDSYLLIEAAVYYRLNDRVSFALNGKNLTNEEVYDSRFSTTEYQLLRRPPRSVRLSVDVAF